MHARAWRVCTIAAGAGAKGRTKCGRTGDLLKGHLGSWKRGQSKITLTDWFDPEGGERTLELDPKLDPAANVERYFTRYRKLTRSSEICQRRSPIRNSVCGARRTLRSRAHLRGSRGVRKAGRGRGPARSRPRSRSAQEE
ncbi:MAG: NFACT family protein [Planctomycetota bacterium]